MNKQILIILSILLVLPFVLAITITPFPTNPISPFVTNNATQLFQYNITTDFMNNLTWSWDNTNYSIYDDSLVLFYNFDNRSALGENDTHVKDLSKYGNNGTVIGGSNVTFSDGKYGKAVNFSGRVNYINVSTLKNNLNPMNGSISMWVIVYGNGTLSAPSYIYRSNLNTRNSIYWNDPFKIFAYTVGQPAKSITTSAQSYNNWHFLVATWANFDTTNITANFYMDNVLIGSVNANDTTTNATLTYLGMFGGSSGQYFNGSIDDIMIYNRSLSASEVSQLYRTQHTQYDSQNHNVSFNESISALGDTYKICSGNATQEVCSALSSISRISTITADFSNSLGVINNYPFGANTHGKYLSNNLTQIDTNWDKVRETTSNQTWHREMWLNAKMTYQRIDMSLADWINNSDGTWSMPSYLERNKETIKFARDNNGKVILVAGYMPTYLQNRTSECQSENQTCGANNWTSYGDLFMTAFNYYTNNGEWNDTVEVEPWNEPFDHFLLHDTSSIYNRSQIYFIIHNVTYTRLKEVYPNVIVIPNIAHFGWANTIPTNYHYDWFFANLSSQFDGKISIHEYMDNILSSTFNSELASLKANCTYYNVNCTDFVITEWNVYSSKTKNTSSLSGLYSSQIAEFYSNAFNQPYNNISLIMYQWSEDYHNVNATEYPQRWEMVSEPLLDNSIYVSYNVTKNFATYCPAGSTVYQSSSDDDIIKTVTCKDGNKYNIIIINTGTDSKNVSLSQLNFFDITKDRIRDVESNDLYPITTSEFNLGVMDSYDIVYLSSETCPHPQTLAEDGVTCQYAVETGCTPTTRSGYNIVMIVASLLLFSFIAFRVYNAYQEGGMGVGELVMIFIIIIVCIGLWLASAQSLGNSCGVVG